LQGAVDGLSPYVANGMINKNNAPGLDFIEFMIIGYDQGVPLVRQVRVKCDWINRKISSPFVETRYPLPNMPSYRRVAFFGDYFAIYRAGTSLGKEHTAMEERYPKATTGFLVNDGKIPVQSSTESIGIAADFVRLQAEFDEEAVGPPINFVVLSRAREPKVSSLTK
jgi:hypothetical protein